MEVVEGANEVNDDDEARRVAAVRMVVVDRAGRTRMSSGLCRGQTRGLARTKQKEEGGRASSPTTRESARSSSVRAWTE